MNEERIPSARDAAGNSPESIPWTAIAARYQLLEKQHAPRLRQLASDLADPEPLIADFAASVAAFARARNIDERFYNPRTESLPDPESVHDLANGRAVLAKVAEAETCQVDSGRTYRCVDYELVPTRKTPGTVKFDNGKTWQSAISLDVLLATEHGAPVVGEVKARTDKDPYFALVQSLAHAAHLGTPFQLQRLKKCYPGQIRGGPVHVAIILSERPTRSNYLELLLHGAQLLAQALMQDKRVNDYIGSIEFLEARLETGRRLTLSCIPPPPSGAESRPLAPLSKLRMTIESWENDLLARLGPGHPLLSANAQRDISWFKNAAAALLVETG